MKKLTFVFVILAALSLVTLSRCSDSTSSSTTPTISGKATSGGYY